MNTIKSLKIKTQKCFYINLIYENVIVVVKKTASKRSAINNIILTLNLY